MVGVVVVISSAYYPRMGSPSMDGIYYPRMGSPSMDGIYYPRMGSPSMDGVTISGEIVAMRCMVETMGFPSIHGW